MLGGRSARSRGGEDGFTLVELLVVILIIAILAAIALPAFLTKRDSAKDAWAKSTARNAVTQMESCMAGADDTATTCSAKPEVTAFGGTPVSVTPNGVGYAITVTSPSGGDFTITKATDGDGHFERSCGAVKVTQGCKSGNTW